MHFPRVTMASVGAAFALLVMSGNATERPPVMGHNAGVSTGHPLTTAAAFEILIRGGNAFDAGVAALLAGGVVEQDLYSLGGEALVLVYPRSTGKVVAMVGQGWAPEGATIDCTPHTPPWPRHPACRLSDERSRARSPGPWRASPGPGSHFVRAVTVTS